MKILSDLIKSINPKQIFGSLDKEIFSIEYDSRKCSDNTLFIAIKGETTDGHLFIQNAINNGSLAVCLERLPDNYLDFNNITFIVVDNTRVALSQLSHSWYDFPTNNQEIIAVTGTNGKTTITYVIKDILKENDLSAAIIGTTGIFYGDETIPATHTTPESLELTKILSEIKSKGIRNIVMEVSSHSLIQHRVDNINFCGAMFTNLTHEHLDFHKTMKEYAFAKKILFDMLPDNSIAVIFKNSEYSELLIKDCKAKQIYFIGRTEECDIQIINEKLNLHNTEFELIFKNNCPKEKHTILSLKTNLLGRFNIDNCSIAAALCYLNGIPVEPIKNGISKTKGAPGRMQRITLRNYAIGIVDYAHTPDALEKALLACKELIEISNTKSNLICVFGCGGDRDNKKRPEMGDIASSIADKVIITNDNPRTEEPTVIANQILNGINSENINKVTVELNRSNAIKLAYQISNQNDIIIIAGKGHENYQILGKEKIHFDDSEELTKYL